MFKFLLLVLSGVFIRQKLWYAVKPSFDCANVQTEAEKLVCADDDLAKLDNELAERYTKIKRYQAFCFRWRLYTGKKSIGRDG